MNIVKSARSQIWFAENLKYKSVRGDFWAFNEEERDVAQLGYLYFLESALKACPSGWHIPSLEEWKVLVDSLGGRAVAGGKLKSMEAWNAPNTGATNLSGRDSINFQACSRRTGLSVRCIKDDND
jgi:uncharacterized protein (TIGR02145 family)